MTTILLIACIGMIAGFFILFGLTPMEFASAVFTKLTGRPKSLRDELDEFTRRKKKSYLRREMTKCNRFRVTGRTQLHHAPSVLLPAVGASIPYA